MMGVIIEIEIYDCDCDAVDTEYNKFGSKKCTEIANREHLRTLSIVKLLRSPQSISPIAKVFVVQHLTSQHFTLQATRYRKFNYFMKKPVGKGPTCAKCRDII